MRSFRDRWRASIRRPAAIASVLAVSAVLVPATSAQAVGADSRIVLDSGQEAADATASYSFVCDLESTTLTGVDWVLYSGRYTFNELQRQSVTAFDVNAGNRREGRFSVDFAGLTEGTYQLRVECRQPGGYFPVDRLFDIAAAEEQTTTTVSASPSRVIAGQTTTVTATVPGAPAGDVVFFGNGSPLASQPLRGGSASLTVPVAAATTYTAIYQGTDGYAGSTSATGAAVSVISEITAPAAVALSGPAVVGSPLTVDLGTWEPGGLGYGYAWKVDGSVVGTAGSYVPTAADLGKTVTVEVTGTHPSLPATTVGSAGAVVQPGTIVRGDLLLDGTVDGQAVLGQPLTPRPVGYGPDAAFSYTWVVGGVPTAVPGESYTPTVADLGQLIQVRATVTAPGKTTVHDSAYAWGAVATPTVTVGSSTTTLGRDALVPVTVAGPTGAPVPAGDVQVTLTPRDGGAAVVLPATLLTGKGTASVTVPGLAVGRYDVVATYLPTPSSMPVFSVATVAPSANPYLTATGAGTVTVERVTPKVTVPASITVPVATQPAFDITVGGTPRPTQYVVREGGTVHAQGQLPADGVLRLVLPVLSPGTHTLVLELPATDGTAAVTRTFTVTVGGEPTRTGTLPTAQLDTPKAATAPGQQMDLVAEGFEPGETVAFYLHSDPVLLGTAVAGADGVARLTATVPADVPAGAHTVIATGGTSGRWASLPVELAVPVDAAAPAAAAAAPAAPGPDLAVTGAQSGALMAGAWLMLLVGGGLVVAARKVRALR